jgi:type 1 glutamine amidotransferase
MNPRFRMAGLALATVLAGALGCAHAQDAKPLPAFKGNWPGATKPQEWSPAVVPMPPASAVPASPQRGGRGPQVHHVLVLGGTHGWHHDSIPSGMAAVFNWGRATHLWESELRTEFSLVNAGGGKPMNSGFQPQGLHDFDAIVIVSATGDWGLDASQKAALLDYVRGGGGVVVMHGGLDANHAWKDYIDMVGGEFVAHPFNTGTWPLFPFPLLNENPNTPMTSTLPHQFVKQDEIYVVRNFTRDDTDVLLSIDRDAFDMRPSETWLPPSHDVPVAWIKNYGKGRVFASSIGHASEAFDDPDVARMYTQAIEWAMHLVGPEPRPHKR